MTTKRFNGKAIYQPSGKAAEYSPWACNFYTGCSNDCEYCYCKRGVMSHVWSTEPKLKKCFKDEEHALDIFEREVILNKTQLQRKGLLFSFTTDPMLPETLYLTIKATEKALLYDIPVKILTKRADWLHYTHFKFLIEENRLWKTKRHLVAFGFTLTGFDEKEPGASTNQERIKAMRKLHDMGFKTFASIEPVIDPDESQKMISATQSFCDLYKVGLISGKGKDFYNNTQLYKFLIWLRGIADTKRIYIKDSFFDFFKLKRELFIGNFVKSDYNLFHTNS